MTNQDKKCIAVMIAIAVVGAVIIIFFPVPPEYKITATGFQTTNCCVPCDTR